MSQQTIWQCKAFRDLLPDELYGLLHLRAKVFIVEQDTAYLDIDGKDKNAWHLILQNTEGDVIACARLLPPGVSYSEASIGRVVVDPDWRGRGLAHELLREAIPRCESLFNIDRIRISAQKHLQDYYAQHGFQPVTEEYLEDNIPHVGMLYIKTAMAQLAMDVRYLGHSAWLVQTQRRNLLFDYGATPIRRGTSLAEGVFNIDELPDLPLYIFISHRHSDHYSSQLHSQMAKRSGTTIIIGLDQQPSCADTELAPTGTTLAWPHSDLVLDDLRIRASGSTDSGVSFLIDTPEGLIYHGGDLAQWDDTAFFRRVYREEIDWLAEQTAAIGRVPDLAFVPVSTSDGYQEDILLQGLWYFLDKISPAKVLPMHANNYEAFYQTFADLAKAKGFNNVLVPKKPGDQFII